MWSIGQKVVCINVDPIDGVAPVHLKEGGIYTIEKMNRGDVKKDMFLFILKEVGIPSGYIGLGYYEERFLPYREKEMSIDVFTNILDKVNKGIKEHIYGD